MCACVCFGERQGREDGSKKLILLVALVLQVMSVLEKSFINRNVILVWNGVDSAG